jgi:hypothetical protein
MWHGFLKIIGDLEVMNAIGHDYGHIREQFVGLLGSSEIPGGLTTDVKIVLQIEEVK